MDPSSSAAPNANDNLGLGNGDVTRTSASQMIGSRGRAFTEAKRGAKDGATGEHAMYFVNEGNTDQGAGINIKGIKDNIFRSLIVATVPKNSPSFRFRAKFDKCPPGHYVLRWRVKFLEDFSVPTGLRFSVRVIYEDEPDATGSLNVIMPSKDLNKLAKGCLYDLKLDELVVVQPCMGGETERRVTVEVSMSNCESDDDVTNVTYSGLEVHFVEPKPFGKESEDQAPLPFFFAKTHIVIEVDKNVQALAVRRRSSHGHVQAKDEPIEHTVLRTATPRFTIDAMDSPVFRNVTSGSKPPANLPISRLAWSKDSTFIAALALWKETAYVTVWNMEDVKNLSNPPKEMPIHQNSFVGAVKCKGIEDLQELSIGLSLSLKGDLVALYQEPKIGQWVDGDKLDRSSFKFTLLTVNRPDASTVPENDHPKLAHPPELALLLNPDEGEPEDDHPIQLHHLVHPPELTVVVDPDEGGSSNASTAPENDHPNRLHQLDHPPNHILENFVGFGTFLTERRNTNWESNDTYKTGPSGGSGGKGQSNKTTSSFVTCNGISIDIFKIDTDNSWESIHSIDLTDLTPTLSRRITCKMMMDAISSNAFMWLEDNGLCYSIWHLWKGSIFSYISTRTGDAKFKGHIFRSNSKMAISPDESIVALAHDGILTTYHTQTSILVDERNFPGCWVEYVGFHGQDHELLVITRSNTSFELSCWILDPQHLNFGMPANQVPVPIMGKTILAFFRGEIFEGKGLICNADGAKIHCYLSHSPPDENTNNHTGLDDPILKDEYSHGNTRYKVRTRIHAESFQGGDDSTYWALRVEVQENENTVFSFVPEPWMRVLTDAVRDPGFLQAVYFLPGGKRFVVIGMQSIQLWSLPTDENRDFNLAFIWSRPRTQVDDSWHKRDGYRTEAVGVHYHCVQRPHIFFDNVTRTVKVRAEMQEGPGKFDTVNIPDDYNTDTRSTFIYCARSIHLLAAAYEYSVYKAKKVPKNLQKLKIAYEKHAEAILRFTRGHINRLLPCEDFVPPKPEDFQDTTRSLGPPGSRSNQRHSGPDRVTSGATLMDHTNKKRDVLKICERDGIEQPKFTTVTTLLLHQDGLKDTNHRFVEKLHDTDSNEWIPHAIKELNPIERAIAVDNEQLLRTLIDHCIKNAKTRHAAYLIPAVQCLDKLLISHPTVLRDLLRRASYVPASSSEYVTSHAVIANVRASDWISFFVRLITFGRYGHNLLSGTKSTNIDDYKNPVFTLRTQLPVTEPNSSQEKRFPEERDGTRPYVNRSREIYVSLLHFYHINLGRRNHSISHVTETDFRESPAIVASLRFEWYRFGFNIWFTRFLLVVAYFILVLIITGYQIQISTRWQDVTPTGDELGARYLPDWRPAFVLTIVVGFLLIIFEFMQFMHSPKKYIKFPYNYVDLAAFVCPIAGCFLFLNATPRLVEEVGKIDGGPSQIWIMGFGILFMYLNMLFELRVVGQLGVVVNIIFNIARRIKWFFLIIVIFLVGFTHALLYVIHTRRYKCKDTGECDEKDKTSYPTGFWAALSVTYFFLSGRYDPVNNNLENGSVAFRVIMVVFFFFTTILLLNVLIALMNDAFQDSAKEGDIGHWKLLAELVTEVEALIADKRSQSYPTYIYYCASDEEAERFQSKYSISSVSSLSPESRFVVEDSRRDYSCRQDEMRQGLTEIRELVKYPPGYEDLKNEVAAVKRLVENPHGYEKMRKEIDELKELVKGLVRQLERQ